MSSLFLDLEGTTLTSAEEEVLRHPFVSGVILFSRNFESRVQLEMLIKEIRMVKKPSLLVSVDQEGGRVQRFRDGFTKLPPLQSVGAKFEQQAERCIELSRSHANVMATELLEIGVDFSFAPVLDLQSSCSTVIGDRAFHANPNVVALLAAEYVANMKMCGMSSVGKHFPGHGLVVEDSHFEIPVDKRKISEILSRDIVPYDKLIKAGLSGVMMAHILYTSIDNKVAGYSQFWIQEVLRKKLGFDGVIFSDDLNMAGAAAEGSYVDRVRFAIDAGCDCVLICNNREAVVEVLDSKFANVDWLSGNEKIERMRAQKPSISRKYSLDEAVLVKARADLRDLVVS